MPKKTMNPSYKISDFRFNIQRLEQGRAGERREGAREKSGFSKKSCDRCLYVGALGSLQVSRQFFF